MKPYIRMPSAQEQALVEQIEVRPIRASERARFMRLLRKHHYLGDLQPVGEQVLYVAVSPNGGWRGLLVFCAAAKHLRHREKWIGWSNEQRRRRLGLVVNNARFLILPGYHVPNLATRILRLVRQRLSADWQERYAHPLAAAEAFVDPEHFQGTIYKAAGWQELGLTDGYGRVGMDYYVRHNRPKRLFVCELCAGARRGLQAEHLKPAWAAVEAKSIPRCTLKTRELQSLVEHLKGVAEYRSRTPTHPVWGLLAIVALAYLCGAPRGQKDLVKFARQLNQGQRRALGMRRDRHTRLYGVPSQPTFCRFLQSVDAMQIERAVLAFQEQVRGAPDRSQVVAIDGKTVRGSQGEQILTAVEVPSLRYLGSAPVPVDKTNEIPVARELFRRLDLEGRLVGLDALHTQMESCCQLVQEHGADYMLTAKDNQKGLRRAIRSRLAAVPAAFSPSATDADSSLERGTQPLPT